MSIPPALAEKIRNTDLIIGSDEAGYGAWAGPLVVAAVCVPRDWVPPRGLTDSKKLSREKREDLFKVLKHDPLVSAVIVAHTSREIDSRGVYRANIEAHTFAHQTSFKNLESAYLHIADGNLNLGPKITSLPKADALIPAVSAASIFAKVLRDGMMVALAKTYPLYGFERHMGYGVPDHQQALDAIGPCPEHRMSYAPVKASVRAMPPARPLWEELPE